MYFLEQFCKFIDGGVTASNFSPKSVKEVSENSNITEIPDVGTWQTGQLSTSSRCFDLLCSGKCDLNENEQKLIVKPAEKSQIC